MSEFAKIVPALNDFEQECYDRSAEKGFHDNDDLESRIVASIETSLTEYFGGKLQSVVVETAAKLVASDLATGPFGRQFDDLEDAKRMLLMVGEVSEAFEELRAGHRPNEIYYACGECGDHTERRPIEDVELPQSCCGKMMKPEGVPIELADVVIRVGDYTAMRQARLGAAVGVKMAYNSSRPAMHGGKKF